MAAITTTTEVARPPEEVFAYVTDPARFAEWQQGVVSGHMDGREPHTVGDTCITTRRIGGSERLSTSEVTHGHGIGKLLVPLIVRRNARTEMSANIARLKEQLELNSAGGR